MFHNKWDLVKNIPVVVISRFGTLVSRKSNIGYYKTFSQLTISKTFDWFSTTPIILKLLLINS